MKRKCPACGEGRLNYIGLKCYQCSECGKTFQWFGDLHPDKPWVEVEGGEGERRG